MIKCLLLTAAALGTLVPATVASTSTPPSHEVSLSGQYLYEFEALLKDTVGVDDPYGSGDQLVICDAHASACHYGWFYNQIDLPNDDLLVYVFTFSNFGPSTLHLMPAWFSVKSTVPGPPFGNRTEPVTINGRLISCNGANTRFLVGNAQALGAGPSDVDGIMVNGGGWGCETP
jgi:hypothetical protein